jgi:hypothetical protein
MKKDTRAAFDWREAQADATPDDVLIAHRDMMYRDHLAIPLAL